MWKCESRQSFSFILSFLFLLLPNISSGNTEIVRTVILNPNLSFKEQVKKQNTSYIIKDKYDLCGETIVLPKNSELVFYGGFMSNGCLKGRNNIITAQKEHIFDKDLSIKGKWRNFYAYPEWYGAKGGGGSDDSNPVQLTLNNFNCILLTDTYLVNSLHIEKTTDITGGCLKAYLDSYGNTRRLMSANGRISLRFNGVSFDGSGDKLASGGILEQMLLFIDCNRIEFNNCVFCRHSQNSALPDETEWQKRRCYAASVLGAKDILFNGCVFHDNHTEQIAIGSNTNSRNRKPVTNLIIKNCRSYNNGNAFALFILFELKSGIIENNEFKDNGRTFFNLFTNNVVFKNNILYNTGSRAITSESNGNYYSVDNIVIESNEIINAQEGAITIGNKDIRLINNTIINEVASSSYDYIVRLGGVFTGDNDISRECLTSLPFYDNTFLKNKEKGKIVIEDNTIIGPANKGIIGIRPTENITAESNTDCFGTIKDVIIRGNKIKVIGTSYAVYFPNGDYSGINISNNLFEMSDNAPIVYISPSNNANISKS